MTDVSKELLPCRTVAEIVSAWAFANDIDGAVRNDLFKRLRSAALPALSLCSHLGSCEENMAETGGAFCATRAQPAPADVVERVAAFLEPEIMAHTGKDWEWRQEQERKYARRLLEETGIVSAMGVSDEVVRLRKALVKISKFPTINHASIIARQALSGGGS